MKKVLNLNKRYDTPEQEEAYQRGYSDGFQDAHTASMKVVYILLSKRKNRSVDVMDEELKNIPVSVSIKVESIKDGKRWSIDG
jgi:hypothetical protein